MAVLRRYNRYQGLKDLDVLIDDDAPISQYFNVVEVPDIITQGRSSFLVGGSPLLKDNVELKFEIINDESGKVIYTEPVSKYLEGTSRRVSIEVYDDPDTFGDATMYVVGELNPNEVNVPPEWQDVYNIRWYSKIYISGTGVNTEPIFFYNQPSMWVGEIVKGFVETNYPTSSVTQSAGTVTGDPLTGTEGTTPEEEAPGDIVETLQKSYVSKVFGGGGKNAGFSSRGRRARRMSPEVERFTINLDGGTATALHVGATFTVNSPKAASSFVTESYHEFPDTFETTVKNVKNDSTLIPTKEFTIVDTRYPVGDPQRDVIVPLEQTAYTMSFQPAPTHSVSTVNFRSFADIRISKLRTFSGDVHRVKLYSKNKDAFGDFELIADTPVESPELLYDVYSSAGSRRVGYFDSQDTINTYWATGSYTTASLDSTYVLDSVYLSGSNKEENSILRFQSTGSLPITFYKDIEYSVRANIIGRKGSKIEGNTSSSYAELGIFLSGSSFVGNHNYGNSFGYQLVPPGQTEGGLLKVDVTDGTLVDFGTVEEVFKPLYNGQGILQFGVPAGSWYISDVSITPVADTGFSPDWIRIVAPVPPLSNERPDDYEFIAEFYDVNNNIADTITHVSASTFAGGNSYILGDDNVLSGSMFIGNAIGSGIEMAGVGSGFVRSIGYIGFTSGSAGTGGPGFLMWSGSVLTDITNEYNGVGLELFAHSGSYMRYRTEPSQLDIRADAFFVGNPTSQFISGSGDNIEISSSNFHVQPDGDVIMQGTITAEAGNIGDWQIIDGKLSGSNATLDAVGAALYHTSKGPGSDSPAGGFHQLRDEYYIDFTPSQGDTATAGKYYVKFGPNFSVSESGVLFASGAVFEGTITASAGLIGGWSIEDTYIGSVPDGLRLYGNSSDSPYHISSSDFQVTTTGEITSSAGLIGGWTITDGYISKALSGSAAHQAYTRVYLSATTDNDKNIQEGLHVYRKDEDIEDGEVKVVRVGGLSDTTNLHANNDYGLQVIQKNSNSNYSNVMYIGESTQTISGFSINPVAIHSSDKSLILSGSGEITGSQVLFTGGKIAGWDLSSTRIQDADGDLRLTSTNPKITIGTHTIGDGPGVQLGYDGSGVLTFFAGQSASDYIKYTAGTGIDIKTAVFKLDTDNLDIDSSNGGSVALGTTPNTSISGTNKGIFMSGSGDFLLYGSATNYFKFDATATAIDIKTDTFDLDAGTVIIDSATNSGKIALGSTPPTAYNSGNGIYMDGTAKFLFGSASADHIQYDGTNFDVQVGSLELAATNIEISSTKASMSLGGVPSAGANILLDGANSRIKVGATSNKQIDIVGHADYGYIATGKTSATSTTAGFWLAQNETDPEFHVGNPNDFIKFDGGELDIQSQKLEISSSTLQVSTAQASMSFGHSATYPLGKLIMEGAGTPTFKMGPDVSFISMTTGSGVYMDGDGNFRFGDDDGGITFNNGSFAITGSDIDISVTDINVSATGFQLSSQHASMSLGTNRELLLKGGSANPYVSIGQSTDSYGETGVFLGYVSSVSRPRVSFVGSAGHFKFDSGVDIDTTTFELDANDGDLQISSTQKSMSLNDQTVVLDGANAKIDIGSANKVTIQGGATDNYMVMGSKTSFTHFDQSTQGIIIGMDSTVPKLEMVGSATNYISYDGSNFDIKLSQGLELAATNIQLSSTHASMSLGGVPGALSNITLDGGNSKIQVGATGSNSVTIQGGTTDNYIVMGSKSSFTHYDKSTAGIILGMDSTVPKFEMAKNGDEYLRWDSTDGLDIRTKHIEVSASNLEISSLQASMSIGDPNSSGGAIVLHADGTDKMLKFGSKTTYDQDSTAGLIMGMDATDPRFDYTVSATQYLRMKTSGIDIATPSFKLDTDRLDIDSDLSRIDVYDDSGGSDGSDLRVRIGEVDPTTGNHYGIVIYDGTGSGSADEIVHLSDARYQIASWSLSPTQITSANLVIDSAGILQTSDFASGLKGWRITSANSGEAEFEKVTVRGTLSTTVFEKESVNAVGGQLYVANSTIYTGSTALTANNTTMSVANVGGFAAGEILSAKKISATGFATEYMYVESASRNYPSSETDLRGNLYLIRGYGVGITGESGSLGDAPTISQSYENGQVIVSTGKTGTGFIRLNANPNDTTTPYMDIVERTGSGVYDISLKARLGDLSGLSSGLLYGETNPGFGLFTENVFLSGAITAQTGSIEGILHVRTDALNQIMIGTNVSASADGIYINDNNYWFTDDSFRIGDTNNYFEWDTSTLTIKPQTLEINAGSGDFQISSTHKSMSFGDGDIYFQSLDSSNSRGRIGSNTSNAIYISGSSDKGYIYSGKSTFGSTTAGFWLGQESNTAKFHVGDSTDYIKFDGSNITVKSRAFELAANTDDLQISSTQKSMSLASGKILLDGGGNFGYIRVGGSVSAAGAIHISGSTTYGIIKAGKTSYTDTVNAGFVIEKTATDSKFYIGDSNDGSFIKFDSDTGIDITSQKFELDANDGDLQLSSTHKSMSLAGGAIKLAYSASNHAYALIGSTGGQGIEITGSNYGGTIRSGKKSISDTDAGFWLHSKAGTPEFHVGDSTEYIKFDGTDLSIASAHLDITASNIDMTTDTFDLIATDLSISSTEASMSLGYDASAAHGITFKGGSPSWIRFGPKTSPTMQLTSTANTTNYLQVGTQAFGGTQGGIILGENSGVETLEIYKDASTYLKFTTGAAGLDVRANKIRLATPGMLLIGTEGSGGSNKLTLGGTSGSMSTTAGEGVYMDGSGNFRVGTATTAATPSYMSFGSSTLTVRTADLVIDTSKLDITTEHGGMIALGASSASLADLSGTGVFLSGSGEFNLEYDSSNYIRQAGSGLAIVANAGFNLSSTDGNKDLLLTTTKFLLDDSATAAASVTRTTGTGIFMNNDGEFRAGVGGGNRIDFDGSTTLTLQSDTFSLTGTNLELSNTKFKLGTLTDVNDIADTSTGFYVDSSGNVLIKAGAANAGYLRATDDNIILKTSEFYIGDATNYISGSGGAIDIAADTFDLSTSAILLRSAQNGGMLSLGATPNLHISGSNKGIYMDGTGDFLVYGSSTNLLKFDAAATAITMKSDTFSLTGTNLELSNTKFKLGTLADVDDIADASTGFYVDSSGNVLIKAGTSANTGYIRATNTDVTIKTGEFVLGDATNYISGSGGAIDVAADTFDLKTANLRVSSSYGGTIAMGATIPTSISGSGVFLSGSGDFLAGNHTGNKIQFNSKASAVVMKSNTFSLDATTVVIDSSANDGKIQLGPSGGPGSATGTTYAGAYLDGTGKFNFVGDSNNYIRFNATGLEIQTPNLTASAAGAVTMAGTVTATAGAIGGWYITSNQISTTTPGNPVAANDMIINTSPYIAMGSINPSTFGSGGIQMGTYGTIYGKFLVANSTDTAGHIKFDAETGDLHISSSTVLIGKSGSADGSGHQPAGAFVSMSAEGQMEISSSGFHFKPGGDGVLAGGNITFEKDGDITSNDYVIERSRLFGAGLDSPTAQASGTPDTLTTGTNQADKYSADDGLILIESHASVANIWTLQRDIYVQDLTINSGVYLETNGYRIFCRGTLTNNGWIRHDGTAGTAGGSGANYNPGSGGAGAVGGSLAAGTVGGAGGRGGYETGAANGGGGGGGGGAGGSILISARYLAGEGGVRAAGANGGNGAAGNP